MSSPERSFLDGSEWILRTRVLRAPEAGVTLTHDAVIRATASTRAEWTSEFWQLFPTRPEEFRALVARGEINVKVMFRFRPTARVKQRYGGHPVLKIARTASGWPGHRDMLPEPIANAIEDYERDKRMLREQRQEAWIELIYLRLPMPPAGYEWELTSGDPRFYGDLLNFRLRASS